MSIRILLVEDEQAIGDFVARGLREEGFAVEWATDGDAGWHHLKTEVWDVVLLDWWLPGQDGLTVLKKFRAAGCETPVLMLTARDALSDRVRGLDGGANDYLCKPFAFEELLARVRALARRPGSTAGTALAHAGVRVDPTTHRAERILRRLGRTGLPQHRQDRLGDEGRHAPQGRGRGRALNAEQPGQHF